jgi:flagellar M-ring protein FliF
MDFLNRAVAQVRGLFESMTPGARITSGLLLVVVVISVGYLFLHGVSGPSAYLMDGKSFSPKELDTMEAAFAQKGLADYVRDGGRVRIPRSKQVDYMAALADANALPRDLGDVIENALRDTNPFQTRQQQEGILAAAKQRMVSQIISSMTGIETAWVMYDSQAKPGLRRDEIKKATVFVKPASNKNLDPAMANSIRRVMPWAGLDPKNVAVADLNSGKTFYGDETDGSIEFDHAIDRKRSLEQEYRTKILEILGQVPGVTVSCNVELGEERLYREEEIKHDPKPVPQQVTETSRSRSQDGSSTNGPPGYLAQGNKQMSLNNAATKSPHEEEEETQRQEYNLISSSRKEIERVPTPIKRVTASVVVPNSYFEKLWSQQNPQETGKPAKTATAADLDQIRKTETDKIRTCVAALLPQPDSGDRLELVAVTPFQDLKLEEPPLPNWHENLLNWLVQSWSTVAVIGLAFISLIMLRSMVRMAPAMPPLPAMETLAKTAEGAEEEDETPEARQAKQGKRFQGTGESLLDDLSDMVSHDPDTAANILRSWIGNVG